MLAGALPISEIQSPNSEVQMYEVNLNDNESRYVDIMFYLKNGYAPHFNHKKENSPEIKIQAISNCK